MSPTAELTKTGRLSLSVPPKGALLRGLAMATGFAACMAWAQALGLDTWNPGLMLGTSFGVGAALAHVRKLWWAPVLAGAGALGAWALPHLGMGTVLLPGALVGIGATWISLGRSKRPLDLVNGALAGLIGLIGAHVVLRVGFGAHALVELVAAGAVASIALLPGAIRWETKVQVPSKRQVDQALKPAYRAPVIQAVTLYEQLAKAQPEADTLDGLGEVTHWVFQLAESVQTLDHDLAAVDEADLLDRIELQLMEAEETTDEFTRDRRVATATHLQELLGHARKIGVERERVASLQDYALAYLEEARVGLTLARALPGEQAPGRLDEVLDRLREHAVEGDTRRATAREVQALG